MRLESGCECLDGCGMFCACDVGCACVCAWRLADGDFVHEEERGRLVTEWDDDCVCHSMRWRVERRHMVKGSDLVDCGLGIALRLRVGCGCG